MLVLSAAAAAGPPEIGYQRGNVHPDFHLPKVGGGFGRLSDFRGKRVLVFHFASW